MICKCCNKHFSKEDYYPFVFRKTDLCEFCNEKSDWFVGRKCCDSRLKKLNLSIKFKIGIKEIICGLNSLML